MFRPGNVIAMLVIGGAVAGVCFEIRAADALALSIAAASVGLALCARILRRVVAALAVAAAMTAWGANARDRALAPSLVTWFDAGGRSERGAAGPTEVAGTLAADAVAAAAGVRLVIDVDAVQERGAWTRVEGRLQAHVSGAMAPARMRDWTKGRRVSAPVTLRRQPVLANFGGPSPRREALRRPYALTGSIKSGAVVDVDRAAWWSEWSAALRARVRKASTRFIEPRAPEAAAIVTAILIGDRAGLSDDVERRLQEAGTYHVIAISGGNVALLTAMCFAGARILIRSARAVPMVTIIIVATYGWVVGADASVARAVAAAVLYLALAIAGLRPPPLAVLRGAAIVLVAIDPLTVVDVGAWLSFAATLGIVSYGRGWTRWLIGPAAPGIVHAGARVAAGLVIATIAAETVLLPVTVSAFSRISLAGVILNLVAIPAMAAVQIAGFVVVCFAEAWPHLAVTAAGIATFAAHLLVASCSVVDLWPWLSWRAAPAGAGWTAGYYASLLCATAATSRRLRVVAIGACAVCLAVIVTAPFMTAAQPAPERLRVTVVDVGQGEAVLLQMPDGRALLVDAGGTPGPFDIGGRVVTPAIWALGVRRLDWLALSHGDRDHVGGALSVLRDLAPGEIWEGVPVPRDPDRAELRAVSDGLRVPWRTVRVGARLELGRVLVESIHPPAPDWERQRVRNDDSIVLRVSYGLVDFWLTGDAGTEFERTVTPVGAEPRLRVLKVGHHGSRTSTSPQLLEALRPQIALISVGRANLFGHPSSEVVSRLERAGSRIFRTDADGAIAVETDGVSVRVSTMSGRTWSLSIAGVPRGFAP